MSLYVAIIIGQGEGCDYTIDCNKTFLVFEAKDNGGMNPGKIVRSNPSGYSPLLPKFMSRFRFGNRLGDMQRRLVRLPSQNQGCQSSVQPNEKHSGLIE